MFVQIHQPLFGGFPMHWARGPAARHELTDKWLEAGDYSEVDAKHIAQELEKKYPNAVVQIKG